jgi:hypothetical protein
VRLDESGMGHISDWKGCRGRMSGVYESRNERRCMDTPSSPADASHAREEFLPIEPIAACSTVRPTRQVIRERVKCIQS